VTDRPTFQPPEPFRCDVRHHGETGFVRPVGELDFDTTDELRRAMTSLREAGARRLVLDLRALDFMDSTGLRLVLEWDAESRRDGISFAVVPGSEAVQRVFRVTGTEGRVPEAEPPDWP
jgi:anti-anti-sigma factor